MYAEKQIFLCYTSDILSKNVEIIIFVIGINFNTNDKANTLVLHDFSRAFIETIGNSQLTII